MDDIMVRRRGRMLAPLMAAWTLACASSHEAVSPIEGVASEVLEAQASTRLAAPNEKLNAVFMAVIGRTVVIDGVRTPAICAPLITAVARRANRAVDVIVTLSANPVADCVPLDGYVATYRAIVPSVNPGRVTVRVFERIGNAAPELRAQEVVDVLP